MIKTFLTSLLLTVLLLTSPSAQAWQYQAQYQFAWSGIKLGEMQMEMHEDDAEYAMKTELRTAGIVAMFTDHRSTTQVKGRLDSTQNHIPQQYRSDYFSGGEDKYIDLAYDKAGHIQKSEIFPPKKDSRPEVDESLQNEAADSLTTVMAMRSKIRKAIARGETEIIQPVFDGKRRFDLVGTIKEAHSSITTPQGQKVLAAKLSFKRVPIAGFKDKELKKIAKGEPEMIVFVEKRYFTPALMQVDLWGGNLKGWVTQSCADTGCGKEVALGDE